MIKIYHSNKLNVLFDFLCENLRNHKGNVFTPFNVVIQVAGLKKWLMLKIADSFGIASNINFHYPNTFFNEITNIDTEKILDRDKILISVVKIFLENNKYYFDKFNINDDFKLFKTARMLSDVFEQYFLFRPKMIAKWKENKLFTENFPPEKWQKELFRKITEKSSSEPVCNLLLRFMKGENRNSVKGNVYHFFAISNMPPIYFDVLQKVSEENDILIYFLNPSEDLFWFDSKSEQVLNFIETESGYNPEEELYFSGGNSLLASLSEICGNFLFSISSIVDDPEGERDFRESDYESALSIIQNDILNNRVITKQWDFEKRDDLSVEIHSVHSEMREIEILYNRLLSFFEKDSSLTPEEIIVMTPDINEYAPYISAVFDSKKPKIPYSIADKFISEDDFFIKTLFNVFEIRKSRFDFSEIFELLEIPFIRKNFALNESDVEILKKWLYKSGVRWGIDENFRQSTGFGFRENSWEFGIERLLLGFVFNSENIFSEIKPLNFNIGVGREVFGNFIKFFKMLTKFLYYNLHGKKSIVSWCSDIKSFVESFFIIDEVSESSYLILSDAVSKMERIGDNIEVSFDFAVEWLKDLVATERVSFNFLDRGVTFCEMIPMRSIPFKVICMLGMNEEKFPRKEKKTDFDIMGKFRMHGDRNVKSNDRYLFLETLLSAEKKLVLSYIGQDIRSNEKRVPSVILSEFTDYLEKRFGKEFVKKITFQHKIHNFSPFYFIKKREVRNFSENDFKVAKFSYQCKKGEEPIFYNGNNPYKLEYPILLTLEDLERFFKHPVKYFFNRNLNLYIDDYTEDFSNSEPFSIDSLTKYRLESEWILSNKESNKEVLKYEGIFPLKNLGKVTLDVLLAETRGFKKNISEILKKKKFAPVFENTEIDKNVALSGKLNEIYEDCMLMVFPVKEKGKHIFTCWLKHLFLNLLVKEMKNEFYKFPDESIIFFNDSKKIFAKVENPRELLKDICSIHIGGLEKILDFNLDIGFETVKRIRKKSRNFSPMDFINDKLEDLKKDDRYYSKITVDCEKLLENSEKLFNPMFDHIK